MKHVTRRRHDPSAAARAWLAAAMLAPLAAPAGALPEADPVAEIRREIEDLRREYDARLAALERRLAALEAAPAEKPIAAPGDELARLREAARAAAGPAAAAPPPALPEPSIGRERNLNRLNPEISVTGIFLGNASDQGREEFRAQEFEIDLQASLDPFSRTRLTLALGEEEPEVEEGYVLYSSLPGGMELMAGRFRQRFGPVNRQHLHALAQSDYPLALQAYFGEEGLAQTGVSLSWLLPRPWASANEVTLEITDGDNEVAFGGESFEDLALLARVKNFWELGDAAYFEWGLSGVVGETAAGGESRVWGTDFTYSWRPPGRAKYRDFQGRAELLFSRRDDELGRRHEAWGGYVSLEGLLRRGLSAGVRLDRVEESLAPELYRWAVVPYLTWWQSEYVRLRAEVSRLTEEPSGETANRFTLQLTWAAGPHKHETY